MKSRVSKRLGLDETASGAEDVLLGYEINDAVRDFLLRTRCNINSGTMALTANQYDYDLDAGILAILDLNITSASSTWPMERTSPLEIMRMRRATSTTGVGRFYAVNGNSLLMIYPTPASADTINIYYVPRPTELSASFDPSTEAYGGIPVEHHPALIEYAAWKMADYDDDATSQMGLQYMQQYERLVKQAVRTIRGKGGRSMGRAVIGRRRLLKSAPSQDTW